MFYLKDFTRMRTSWQVILAAMDKIEEEQPFLRPQWTKFASSTWIERVREKSLVIF